MADLTSSAYKCGVCGYIHRGSGPPETCPVCGAPKVEFAPHEDAPIQRSVTEVSRWRCQACGYVHGGDEPPEKCPVCGAPRGRLEPIVGIEDSSATRTGIPEGATIIIGGGIAGVAAAESFRSANTSGEVILVSREEELPYYRINLTRFLSGEVAKAALTMHPESWYAEQGIDLRRGADVAELDAQAQTVRLASGEELSYSQCILTAGAHPFVPPVEGACLDGATSLRSVSDAEWILEQAQAGREFVVIGGGILGLEAAGGIARRGAPVTVLEGYEWLLPRQLNRRAGERLQALAEDKGIRFRTGVSVEELAGDDRVRAVRLKGDESLAADVVVFSTGIRPNSFLARRAGLRVDKGVVVNDYLRTSDGHIFAAGDIAEHRGVLYGLWGASQYQGAIAGLNAAGAPTEFGGIPRSNTLKVLGIDMFSIGLFEPDDASYRVFDDDTDERYYRFVFHDHRLVGTILIGDASLSTTVSQIVDDRRDLSRLLEASTDAQDVASYLATEG